VNAQRSSVAAGVFNLILVLGDKGIIGSTGKLAHSIFAMPVLYGTITGLRFQHFHYLWRSYTGIQ
jgi:hypothetical protein